MPENFEEKIVTFNTMADVGFLINCIVPFIILQLAVRSTRMT